MNSKTLDFITCKYVMKELNNNKKELIRITRDLTDEELLNYQKDPSIFDNLKGTVLVAYKGKVSLHRKYIRDFLGPYIIKEKERRSISSDVSLIAGSLSTIDILGINSLAPLHSGRERIRDFLNKNQGNVRLLILDPHSEAFDARANKEESRNGFITGRLKAEYEASIGICKDILNFTNFTGNFEIKTYNQTPLMSMVISDRDKKHAVLNCNIYPDEENTRGLEGSHRLNITKRFSNDEFIKYQEHFEALWKDNDTKSINELEIFVRENKHRVTDK